jgi:hypothetical protein
MYFSCSGKFGTISYYYIIMRIKGKKREYILHIIQYFGRVFSIRVVADANLFEAASKLYYIKAMK